MSQASEYTRNVCQGAALLFLWARLAILPFGFVPLPISPFFPLTAYCLLGIYCIRIRCVGAAGSRARHLPLVNA